MRTTVPVNSKITPPYSESIQPAKYQMYRDNASPSVVDLYISDLKKLQHLTTSQEIWLGIAIDAEKLLRNLLNTETPTRQDAEYLQISVFNKIRAVVEELESATKYQDNSFSFLDQIKVLFSEAIEFKYTTIPVKQSILSELLNIIPERVTDRLFDLANFLLLPPLSILNYCCTRLREKNRLPPISDLLDFYNSLEGSEEINNISARALSAREMLINSYLSYVKWFAYQYRNYGLAYEDVIQEGNIGLIKAVDKFDVRRNVKLKTMAIWWIRQSITRAIADNSRVIRLPVHLSDALQSLKHEYRKYIDTHLEEPSLQTLSELSGLDVKRISELILWVKPPIPLEKMSFCENTLIKYTELRNPYQTPWCQDCERMTRIQRDQVKTLIVDSEIPICIDQSLITPSHEKSDYASLLYKTFTDNDSEDRVDQIFREKLRQNLNTALDQLNARERRIIDYRYGFKDREADTLQGVGDKFGVTRERIRQIETNALVKLRQILERNPTVREYNSLE